MPLGYYPYMPNPNTPFYNDAPMNYNESSTNSSYDHQQIEPPRSSGLFDYVFGRGGNDNDEGDSGGDVWFRPDSFLSYFFFFCSVFVLCFFLVFCLVCDGLIGDVMWFEVVVWRCCLLFLSLIPYNFRFLLWFDFDSEMVVLGV
jgi:hypothetical protein